MLAKYIPKSAFFRNVFTLASGAALSQILSIIVAPINARMYDPHDYGVLGMYMSVTALVAVVCTFRYETAILLPEKDEEAIRLMYICLLSGFAIAGMMLIAVLFWRHNLANYFQVPQAANWLLFAPLSIAATAVGNSFTLYNNRRKRYRNITLSRLIPALIGTTITLVTPYIVRGPYGLMVSLITIHTLTALIAMIPALWQESAAFTIPLRSELWVLVKRYRDYPLFSLPAEFINTLANQVPVFFLASYVGPQAVGYYNMSNRLLGLPTQFVAGAIGDVFRQRASEDYVQHGNCAPIYLKTFRTLFFIGIVPFGVLLFCAPQLFSFVLGEKWHTAGEYSQIMGLMVFAGFIVKPLSYMYYIADKLREDFVLHIYIVVSNIVALYLGVTYLLAPYGVYGVLAAYTINYISIYALYLVRTYQFSKGVSRRIDDDPFPKDVLDAELAAATAEA